MSDTEKPILETTEKPWWQSKTIFGASIAVYAGIAGFWGIEVSNEDQQRLLELLLALGPIIGGLISVFGRIKAKHEITK